MFVFSQNGGAGIALSVQRLAADWTVRIWIPVRARFSAPVQNVSESHPASYTMGTGSFPGLKRPECDVDHPPPSSVGVKERVELYFSPLVGLRGLF
jgi:hypothetical protein